MSALEDATRATNAGMIAFDLGLASGALLAPAKTLALLGHSYPSEDAEHLFRRCAPIWFTFAAAHIVAARRGDDRDWWALAWLRGTELLTDVVWARSPSFGARGRAGMVMAGLGNLAMTAAFARLSRRR